MSFLPTSFLILEREREKSVDIFSLNTKILPQFPLSLYTKLYETYFQSKLLYSNFVSVWNIFGSLCAQNKWKPNNLTRKLMKYQIFFCSWNFLWYFSDQIEFSFIWDRFNFVLGFTLFVAKGVRFKRSVIMIVLTQFVFTTTAPWNW